MKRWRTGLGCAAVGITLLALAACNEVARAPDAQEPTDNTVAEFCGMSLQEHPGPKAQIFVKGRDAPYWFSSVHDMFAFMMIAETHLPVIAIYVNDIGKAHIWNHPEPGTWIEARNAVFVIGSDRRGGMDEAEAIPFGTEAAARQFIADRGGRMVRFDAMPIAYILPGYSPNISSSEARSNLHD